MRGIMDKDHPHAERDIRSAYEAAKRIKLKEFKLVSKTILA
jgi:hypothetical protein